MRHLFVSTFLEDHDVTLRKALVGTTFCACFVSQTKAEESNTIIKPGELPALASTWRTS